MLKYLKKSIIISLSLLLVLSSCESPNKVGSCTDDPGDGSTVVSSKPDTIFSNGSGDLWQTELADWQDTPYYTDGKDIIINIGTGNLGSIDAHGGSSTINNHPCNICSKIVKYNSNGSIAYQTPNCICGPKIYGPPMLKLQSFRYLDNSREVIKPIETIKPECEIILGYLEKAHYGIIDRNERITCKKDRSEQIITVSSGNSVDTALSKNDINSQEYTCIPMEWALNLGGSNPDFISTPDQKIDSFLNKNYLQNGKYYSKATHLLTADFKNISDSTGISGYEIVHFPINYYEKELHQTETDQAKITVLKDVNYHNVSTCVASNGFSLHLGLFPENSDMPGYNGKIYAYHLYSFNQICRIYRNGVCENAITQFKLAPSDLTSILPNSFLDHNHQPIAIPSGYKIKFKIYDNFYTSNSQYDKYNVTIISGIQTQNSAKQNEDEGIITDSYKSLKQNDLIRVTYENFIVKNIIIIRIVMALFLLFYAVGYLMGISEINQKELTLRVFKIAIVFAFLDPSLIDLTTKQKVTSDFDEIKKQYSFTKHVTFGFWFYQQYVINIILDGLNSLIEIITNFSRTLNLDGASSMQTEVSFSSNVNFAYFDKILEKIFSIKTVGAIISAIFTKWLIGGMLLGVFLYFLVKTIFKLLMTYILNWLQIILVLGLGPIFFLFLLFSKTKGFFTKWLAFVFARALDIVILIMLTFPFISILYADLLGFIGGESCLRPIGPSFLKTTIWIQNDNVDEELNNFFGYIFALVKSIALVYMTSLIASYAPKISGAIINIANNQNTAGNSLAASNLAAQTTTAALNTITSGAKFINSSYVGGMAKSYIKQGAFGLSNFVGATRVANFAKHSAINLLESLTYRNATEIFLGKETAEAIFGKKPTSNAPAAGAAPAGGGGGAAGTAAADGGGAPAGGGVAGAAPVDGAVPAPAPAGAPPAAPVDGGVPAAGATPAGAGAVPAPAGAVPAPAGGDGGDAPAGGVVAGDVAATPAGPPPAAAVPAFAGGVAATPAGAPPAAPVDGAVPAGSGVVTGGVAATPADSKIVTDENLTQRDIEKALEKLKAQATALTGATSFQPLQREEINKTINDFVDKQIDSLIAMKKAGKAEIKPDETSKIGDIITKTPPSPQEMLEFISQSLNSLVISSVDKEQEELIKQLNTKIAESARIPTSAAESTRIPTSAAESTRIPTSAAENVAYVDGEFINSSKRQFSPSPTHTAAPPPVEEEPKKEPYSKSVANDNYSKLDTQFLSNLQQKFIPFANSELKKSDKKFTIENALDLFIEANNAKLKQLNIEFMANQNISIDIELQRVFEKFKTDFTSISKSMSQQTEIINHQQLTTQIATTIIANSNSTIPDAVKQTNFSTIATKLKNENVLAELQQNLANQSILKQQEALASFLADRDKTRESAELKKILEQIEKETKEQQRINHFQEIFSQAEKTAAFAKYHNPEKDTSAISQEELMSLKEANVLKLNDEQIKELEKYSTLRNEKLFNELDELNDDKINALRKLPPEQIEKVLDYLSQDAVVAEMITTKFNEIDLTQHQATTPEQLEIQRQSFDTILKLMGVKYKSDRNKALDFLFTPHTGDSITDLQVQFDKMYVSLEKPLKKIHKKDEILTKLLTSINEDIQKKLEESSQDNESENIKLRKILNKNEITLKRIDARQKSFESLFARIEKAINKS